MHLKNSRQRLSRKHKFSHYRIYGINRISNAGGKNEVIDINFKTDRINQ